MANEADNSAINGEMPDNNVNGAGAPVQGEPNANNAGDNPADKAGESEADKSKESLRVAEERIKKLEEGWREDREYYQGEIKRHRQEASHPVLTEKEKEELEDLDEDERVDKKIEFREKRQAALKKAEMEAVKSEVRFYERTSTEFAENKKEILKVAEQFNCQDLKQAILMWRGMNITKANKDAVYHDQRKKDADGRAGGHAGGSPAVKPYDSATDGKKSFGDLYREAGVK